MSRKVSLHKLIEHDGARYNAAVHRRVLVVHRKIVVEPVDDLDRLVVGDRAARLRLLRAGKTVCSIVSGTPESVIFSLMVSFLHLFRALCLPANGARDAL